MRGNGFRSVREIVRTDRPARGRQTGRATRRTTRGQAIQTEAARRPCPGRSHTSNVPAQLRNENEIDMRSAVRWRKERRHGRHRRPTCPLPCCCGGTRHRTSGMRSDRRLSQWHTERRGRWIPVVVVPGFVDVPHDPMRHFTQSLGDITLERLLGVRYKRASVVVAGSDAD